MLQDLPYFLLNHFLDNFGLGLGSFDSAKFLEMKVKVNASNFIFAELGCCFSLMLLTVFGGNLDIWIYR